MYTLECSFLTHKLIPLRCSRYSCKRRLGLAKLPAVAFKFKDLDDSTVIQLYSCTVTLPVGREIKGERVQSRVCYSTHLLIERCIERSPLLYAPGQTCPLRTSVWGSLSAGSRRFSSPLRWSGLSVGFALGNPVLSVICNERAHGAAARVLVWRSSTQKRIYVAEQRLSSSLDGEGTTHRTHTARNSRQPTHAVAHPHAVVVHLQRTPVAHAAVVRHRRLVPATRVAPPPPRLSQRRSRAQLLCLVWRGRGGLTAQHSAPTAPRVRGSPRAACVWVCLLVRARRRERAQRVVEQHFETAVLSGYSDRLLSSVYI
jgi:hypothetical protein